MSRLEVRRAYDGALLETLELASETDLEAAPMRSMRIEAAGLPRQSVSKYSRQQRR